MSDVNFKKLSCPRSLFLFSKRITSESRPCSSSDIHNVNSNGKIYNTMVIIIITVLKKNGDSIQYYIRIFVIILLILK